MIRNIIITAFRNLQKNKLYASINIFGLSIAMASFIVIFLLGYSYIKNDKFNENYKSIYRLERKLTGLNNGNINKIFTPAPLANEIQSNYPEINSIARFLRFSNFISDKDDSKFLESGAFIDNSFFNIFSYEFKYGNASDAFSNPNSIILTDKLANKLFNKENVIGKIIRLDNKVDLTITAVIKEERETNFYFSYLLPFPLHTEFVKSDYNYTWEKDSSNVQTFLLFDKKYDYSKLNLKISKELSKHCEDYEESILSLKPLSEINYTGSNETRWKFLLLPITLAIFILSIACINFTQLAVAYSTNRGKEVAIRKLNGSRNIHIKIQHIGEAITLAYISLVIGFFLAEIALPIFNKGFSNDLNIEYFNNWEFSIFMILIATITGIFSGSYPAFFLSSQKAINVLKNGIKPGKKGLIINKVLVISQSAFSIILILTTIYIVNQINYINNRDIGFNEKNILISSFKTNDEAEANKIKLFRELLKKESYISNAALSYSVPYAFGEYEWKEIEFENFNHENKLSVQFNEVGYNYFDTYEILLTKGRFFSKEKNEFNNCIINEAAAKPLGNEELLGKKIDNKYTIVGIVKDYHTYISFENAKPLMLTFKNDFNNKMSVISIKLNGNNKNLQNTKKTINTIYQSVFPEDAIETKLLEDEINFYKEYLISAINLMKIFTFITIIISLIGVLGLVSYLTKRRYKEISIRKVLGAGVKNIYYLIINQFFKLLMVSFFISLPLSYLITKGMLQMFSDRINITVFWFILIPIVTIITVVISISIQSYNAASKNPIIALRDE